MNRALKHLCSPAWAAAAALWLLFPSHDAAARPEYAVKLKVDCASCHVYPWGGGPRTVFGKIYGSHGWAPAKTSMSDVYFGDLRTIAFYPLGLKETQTTNGIALMEAAASADVQVTSGENGAELRAVGTYNASPLQSGVREAYFRWQTTSDEASPVRHVIVGRFNPAFGLLTDEHRTYTRMQTNMSINSYELGGALSGNWFPRLHYDFQVMNDLQSGGLFTNNDVTGAEILNMRWIPDTLPLLLGASQTYQHDEAISQHPFAFSAYALLSLDRLTHDFLHGSVSAEGVVAKNWNNPAYNPSLGQFFIPATDAAFQSAVSSSWSNGYYGLLRYDLTEHWTLIYKFDYLALDMAYPDDAYMRHGIGFETYPMSNMVLDARLEKAIAGRPEINGTPALAAEDDFILMLRLWL